jgi:hypothetical protein
VAPHAAQPRDKAYRLAPLVRSPRGANRLINLYRLLRARLSTDELPDFLEGPEPGYQAAMVLLALAVGPSDPSQLFKAIDDASESVPWRALLREFLGPVHEAPLDVATYQRWLPLVRRFSFSSG